MFIKLLNCPVLENCHYFLFFHYNFLFRDQTYYIQNIFISKDFLLQFFA